MFWTVSHFIRLLWHSLHESAYNFKIAIWKNISPFPYILISYQLQDFFLYNAVRAYIHMQLSLINVH